MQKLEEEEKKTLDSLAVAEAELVQQGELLKVLKLLLQKVFLDLIKCLKRVR